MAKVERLMQLVELITSPDDLTISEMSAECRVSERTIYRYLKTISDLNLPSTGMQSRKLKMSKAQQPLSDNIKIKELWVASKCIANNSINSCPIIDSRINLKEEIQKSHHSKVGNLIDKSINLIAFASQGVLKNNEFYLLEIASEAIKDSKKIELTLLDKNFSGLLMNLNAIRLAADGIWLVGKVDGEQRSRVIGLSEIANISLEI